MEPFAEGCRASSPARATPSRRRASGDADPGGRGTRPAAGDVAEVDVEHAERLEVPRIRERARIHRLEARALDEGTRGVLRARVVAGVEDLRLRRARLRAEDLREDRVERLDDPRTGHRLLDLLGGRRGVADAEPRHVGLQWVADVDDRPAAQVAG